MKEMTRKEKLIAKIMEIEWGMLQDVPNFLCQKDPKAFEIMRSSQFMSWSDVTLESYLGDLTEAENSVRNLLTEKYARMMKSTSPSEYYLIEHLIPQLDPEVLALIDQIVEIVLEWEETLSKKYPHILRKGRPLHSSDDTHTHFGTSMEAYLRGELATYSPRTLGLYYENVLKQKSENVNGSEIILSHMVKQYGFKSLEEANERLNTQA